MKKQGIWSAIKTLWKIGNAKDRVGFFFLIFMGFIRAVSELIVPLVTACIISKLSGESASILWITFPDDMSVTWLIICCFAILFGFYFLGSSVRALTRLFASNMKTKTNLHAMELLLQFRKNCDLHMSKGEASYVIKEASEYVEDFIENGIVKIVCPIMSTVIAVVYIATLSLITLPILILTLVLISAAVWGRMHFDGVVYKKLEDINGNINNHVINNIENLPFVSFLKSKVVEMKIAKGLNKKYFKTDKKRIRTYILYWLAVNFTEFACAISIVLLVLHKGYTGVQGAAVLIVVIPYLLTIFTQTENLGAVMGSCQRYGISISRISAIATDPKNLIKMYQPKTVEGFISVEKLDKEVVIEKLKVQGMSVRIGSFENTYDATFYAGQLNCISGMSGGGKTTFINALLGVIEHKEGTIIVNDKYVLNNLFFESERVSIAFQGENFFDRRLVDNMMYPKDELDERARKLIKKFQLEELLTRERESGENFKNKLSGGEKKRLSLIRCISKDAEIYILDEPTNELDEGNVKKALDELEKLKKHSIVIVISHDKRLMERADNIMTI